MNIGLWNTFLTESAAANYDVVVIALGINDANVADKSADGWGASHSTAFTTALKNLVAAVAQANPNAEIMIMTCCAHFRVEGNSGNYTPIVSTQTVVNLQKQTAQELNLPKNLVYDAAL
jgi:lysophospholipase L1-like esterase